MAKLDTKTKLFFLSGIDNLRDPARSTRWRLLIPSEIFAATGISPTNGLDFGVGEEGTDDFALHVKSCQIPGISIDDDKHHYMGFESSYPVKANIDADINFETILLEDMRAYEAVLAWQQSIINTGVLVDGNNQDRMNETGLRLGLGNHKDIVNETGKVLRNSDIKIELYNWMRGESIMQMRMINAYPTKVDGMDLSYSDAKILNFKFNLHCDRWTVKVNPDYQTGLD
jgi:hypothetical protein